MRCKIISVRKVKIFRGEKSRIGPLQHSSPVVFTDPSRCFFAMDTAICRKYRIEILHKNGIFSEIYMLKEIFMQNICI